MGVNARLLIVADDRVQAGALATALGARGFEVVGIAGLSDQLGATLAIGPDGTILIADGPPDPELVGRCAAESVVLAMGPDEDSAMLTALEAGASGYLERSASFADVAEAVEAVLDGQAIVPPSLLGALLRHVVRRRREERLALTQLEVLTDREREVMRLVARGHDKKSIAELLFISPETARTHIHNIMKKLDLHTQVEIVALAARCGWEIGDEDG